MTADQFVLLDLLTRESEVTQQTLVVRAYSDPNTVRTMLVLLEGRGLVTRKRHPLDGRARSVSLTARGRKAVERIRSACGRSTTGYFRITGPRRCKPCWGCSGEFPPS